MGWGNLYEDYNAILPVYEKTSKAITLWQMDKWRRETIRLGLKALGNGGEGISVLDAGSGPGNMTMELLKGGVNPRHIVMLDQSIKMLRLAPGTGLIDKVCGSFELMPFRDSTFNMVIMGFALHASSNLRATYCEISRVLKPNGVLASVSIGKPDNVVFRALGWLYTAVAVPVITLLSAGPGYIKYFYDIHTIYVNLPPNSKFRGEAEGCLRLIDWRDEAFGLANVAIMVK